ncbi:DNA repair exonuclease [Proteinivorax tanatarense]|uniref:DNA repair exonuclease n=1 Tax=Proteinivorax tanatarense TaxID=1260629 RepID=A0AAU7VLB9_9FIRM
MIKFIHCADIHLNRPFFRLQTNKTIQKWLSESSYNVLDKIAELAVLRKVDFIVIAGDLLDNLDQTVKAEIRCRNVFEYLDLKGISVFIVGGNHDPINHKRRHSYPKNVHVFSSSVETVPLKGFNDVYIHGVSYPTEIVKKNLAKDFPQAKGKIDIGVLHCEIGGNLNSYSPCTKYDLLSKNYQYWSLGHIHKPTVISEFPAIIYSGSPMGKTPNEIGERGCYYVEATPTSVKKEFCSLAEVIWLQQEIDIKDLDLSKLVKRIKEGMENLKNEHQKNIIVRTILKGRGKLHNISKADLQDIVDELRTIFTSTANFVWLESIQKETKPDADLDTIKEQQGFLGDFLNYCEQAENDNLLKHEIYDEVNRGNIKLISFLDEQDLNLDQIFEAGLQRAIDEVLEKGDCHEGN